MQITVPNRKEVNNNFFVYCQCFKNQSDSFFTINKNPNSNNNRNNIINQIVSSWKGITYLEPKSSNANIYVNQSLNFIFPSHKNNI